MSTCESCTLVDWTATLPAKRYPRYYQVKLSIAFHELVVSANRDFSADLEPAQYNLLAQRRVRRRFGFVIVVVENNSDSLEQAVAFFQQVKQRPDLKCGILRIML